MAGRLKTALCESLYRSGVVGLAASVVEPRDHLPGDRPFQILIYHRVGDDGDDYVPAISVSGFERHMQCLRQHFRPMSITDLLAAAERREMPARAVAVTFDDGYLDVFTQALPILRRYRIPATVYVATAFMAAGEPMWNDRLGCAIRSTNCARLDSIADLDPLPLRTTAQRHTAFHRVLTALKRRPPAERDVLTAAVVQRLGVDAHDAPRMLRWEQVRDLHRAGIDIGAHTVHHPILSALPPDQAWSEIAASKRAIEEALQAPVHHFAYPNGTPQDFDAGTEAQVARAGFASAVSTVFGVNSSTTNRYALRRGGPWEEDAGTFSMKLWWYRWRDRAHTTAATPARSALAVMAPGAPGLPGAPGPLETAPFVPSA